MQCIRLSELDAEILYSIPESGGSLEDVLRKFLYIYRMPLPEYEQFSNCIARAIAIECLVIADGKFKVADNWFDRIHAGDETKDYLESVSLWVDDALSTEFVATATPSYSVDRKAYNHISKLVNSF